DGRWHDIARDIVNPLDGVIETMPLAVPAMATAAAWLTGRVREIAVVGDADEAATRELVASAWRHRDAHTVIAWGPNADAVPLLNDRPLRNGVPTVYVCEGFSCKEPVTDADSLAR